MTTPADLTTLATAAQKAQDALTAEREKQEAVAAAEAAERTARSIEWSWDFVVGYNQRQGEAGERVSALLASITDAITVDLALAARLYLDCITAMSAANRLGEDLVRVRSILKAADFLPGVHRQGRDPVGDSAPFPLTHGLVRFPSFIEFVSETLDKQRAIASRHQSGETPETYQGKASEGLKAEALRREWVLAAEFESLLALREQWPERFAQPPLEEQASVDAYARAREAVGYEAELPKIAASRLVDPEPPKFAPDDVHRWTLNR